MVASGPDAMAYAQGQAGPVALAMETMYEYTAYFADNDPRYWEGGRDHHLSHDKCVIGHLTCTCIFSN